MRRVGQADAGNGHLFWFSLFIQAKRNVLQGSGVGTVKAWGSCRGSESSSVLFSVLKKVYYFYLWLLWSTGFQPAKWEWRLDRVSGDGEGCSASIRDRDRGKQSGKVPLGAVRCQSPGLVSQCSGFANLLYQLLTVQQRTWVSSLMIFFSSSCHVCDDVCETVKSGTFSNI